MERRFNHQEIEKRSQEKWESLNLYETNLTDSAKDPYYLLFEFPYPSGDLHIGHWYAYAVTDIYARMQRMRGKNVLFPIGFDAFGLPAENAAMKRGADPKVWTFENMDKMRAQIRSIGTSVDWSKEVVTCDPSYYQWTQWLFAKFYEKGIAYRGAASVKWCPKDQTVLANEQVIDGKCERCDTEIEEKRLTQWFMKITAYAEKLLTGLDTLSWREDIKEAQRQWIGKSEGAKLWFSIADRNEKIEVFTTRPDTVFGATYLVLAPEHALVETLLPAIENKKEIISYREKTAQKTERERSEHRQKTGILLKGITVINPATKEEIPVYIADYVIASYGTGAVMAVPAHDERDFEFAKDKKLRIKPVIVPPRDAKDSEVSVEFAHADKAWSDVLGNWIEKIRGGEEPRICYTGDGVLINSGAFTGKHNRDVFADVISFVGGEKTTNYRIRDWLISRQRYWGCPIPVVYDPAGKAHYVGDENLPWILPSDVDFTPSGKAPLASSRELHERVERIFGIGWTPEYDTLDTFVDSSWYYLRYLTPKNTERFSDKTLMETWLPVDRYSGGTEHTTMHLLYARFFHKALHDLGLVPSEEPFTERFNRGIILGSDGQKMSKRWGNVINPDDMVAAYGADAVRMYLAFIGPYSEAGHYPWKLDGVEAMRKLLERIYTLAEKVGGDTSEQMRKAVAKASVKVTGDGDRFKFNTALAAIMILTKELEASPSVAKETYLDLLTLLAPFAPHLTEHLWEQLGQEGSIHGSSWPTVDASLLQEEEVTIVVQVNGKRRGTITVARGTSEGEAFARAQELPSVAAACAEKQPRIIFVPDRILNLVIPE